MRGVGIGHRFRSGPVGLGSGPSDSPSGGRGRDRRWGRLDLEPGRRLLPGECSRLRVDWYHAAQHVAQAATALPPTDEAAAQRWQHEQRLALYVGQIDKITAPLDKAGLTSVSQYFHTHERRMQYQEFREQGYPLGSGTVESGIKRFKQRVTGPGMRWSRVGAERMLLIRAAVMTHNFDALWAETRN